MTEISLIVTLNNQFHSFHSLQSQHSCGLRFNQLLRGSFSPNHFVPLLSKSAMSRVTCTIDLSGSNSEAHNVVDELDLTESCQPDVSCEMQSDVTISSDPNMSNETVVDNEQNMSNETVVDNEQNMSNQYNCS